MAAFQPDKCTSVASLSKFPSAASASISGSYLAQRTTTFSLRQHHCCRHEISVRGLKRGGNQQQVPLALAAAFAILQVVKRLRSNTGSLSQLESRGLIDEDRHGTDPFYSDMMKNVNTVQMEELSEEQIAAARARRLKERESYKVDIDDIVLPDNHPFAVKKPVTKEDEELVEARLNVRRGLPIQDLSGRRGFPDDGKGQADMLQDADEDREVPNIVRRPRIPVKAPVQPPVGAGSRSGTGGTGREGVREAIAPGGA